VTECMQKKIESFLPLHLPPIMPNGGKLLKPATYTRMFTMKEGAVRDHPLFGKTYYGYGPTITEEDGITWVGQTGFCPGFVSMNYYYPATKPASSCSATPCITKTTFPKHFTTTCKC
jgi:hypothetical protein